MSRSASTPFRLICATLTSPDLPRERPLFMATNTQPIEVIARLLDLTERRVPQLARDGGQLPQACGDAAFHPAGSVKLMRTRQRSARSGLRQAAS